jgi:hypothetical protein
MVVAIGAVGLWSVKRLPIAPSSDEHTMPGFLAAWLPVAAATLVLVGLTAEISRAVDAASDLVLPATLVRVLWTCGLWAVGGMAMVVIGGGSRLRRLVLTGWTALGVTTVAWLTIGTLTWRLGQEPLPVPVGLNLQAATGALLVALFAALLRLARGHDASALRRAGWPAHAHAIAYAALGALGLWIASFEVDRALAGSPMAAQAGLSVVWALYGVALVVLGFARRAKAARYAGLALLTITVGKVLVIDLATIETVWRVVSFFVSGLLLVGTSVLYSRLSPRLLAGSPGTSVR